MEYAPNQYQHTKNARVYHDLRPVSSVIECSEANADLHWRSIPGFDQRNMDMYRIREYYAYLMCAGTLLHPQKWVKNRCAFSQRLDVL